MHHEQLKEALPVNLDLFRETILDSMLKILESKILKEDLSVEIIIIIHHNKLYHLLLKS